MDFNKFATEILQNARHVLNNYANFEGRAGLREFWLWFLLLFVTGLLLQLLGQSLSVFHTISLILNLALAIPSLAVGARRLHDTGRSGWLQLLAIIPLVGFVVLLYFWAQPSGSAKT